MYILKDTRGEAPYYLVVSAINGFSDSWVTRDKNHASLFNSKKDAEKAKKEVGGYWEMEKIQTVCIKIPLTAANILQDFLIYFLPHCYHGNRREKLSIVDSELKKSLNSLKKN